MEVGQSFGGDMMTAAAVCNVCGSAIRGMPSVPNWIIPVVLPFIGAVSVCLMSGWSGRSFVSGFISGTGAVGLNQAFRQVGVELDKRNQQHAEQAKELKDK